MKRNFLLFLVPFDTETMEWRIPQWFSIRKTTCIKCINIIYARNVMSWFQAWMSQKNKTVTSDSPFPLSCLSFQSIPYSYSHSHSYLFPLYMILLTWNLESDWKPFHCNSLSHTDTHKRRRFNTENYDSPFDLKIKMREYFPLVSSTHTHTHKKKGTKENKM